MSERPAILDLIVDVYQQDTGERIRVQEDSDGLEMVELRYLEKGMKSVAEIRFPVEHTGLIIAAIQRVAAHIHGKVRKTRRI